MDKATKNAAVHAGTQTADEYLKQYANEQKAARPNRHEDSEAADQETVFQWAEMMNGKYPELRLMFHVPNGGSRNALEAANLKRQGVKAGVPDICLPVPHGRYHGLYIELKHGKNKPSEQQDQWITDLRAQGYAAYVCVGWELAVDLIEKYIALGAFRQKQKRDFEDSAQA